MEAKNAKNQNKKVKKEDGSGCDKYFRWSLVSDRELANVLRDERNLGNKGDGGWKPVAYISAANILSAQFAMNVTSDNIKNRVKTWKKYYGVVSDILAQSGFSWDAGKQMITVDDDNVWNDYVKSHNDAKSFRWKVIENWDDIVDLCGKDRATGEGAETPFDVDEVISVDPGSDNESDKDELETYLSRGASSSRSKKHEATDTSATSPEKKKGTKVLSKKNKIEDAFGEMASCVGEYFRSKPKKLDMDEVYEVVSSIQELDEDTFFEASNLLMDDENKFQFMKKLPESQRKKYLLKCLSHN